MVVGVFAQERCALLRSDGILSTIRKLRPGDDCCCVSRGEGRAEPRLPDLAARSRSLCFSAKEMLGRYGSSRSQTTQHKNFRLIREVDPGAECPVDSIATTEHDSQTRKKVLKRCSAVAKTAHRFLLSEGESNIPRLASLQI